MVRVICDRCGKEISDYKSLIQYSRSHFIFLDNYDFCEECRKIYDQLKSEHEEKAEIMREQCEKAIEEEMNKMLKEFKYKKKEQ